MHGFISGLSIFPMIYVSVFVQVPNCFDNCSFIEQFEIRECICLALFFFKIALTIWDLLFLYTSLEKGMTEDEMAEWHHRLDGHEFE